MKPFRTASIIHTFAILHAAAALSCRIAGIEDELFLTVLTMTMILLICIRRKLNIEFSAASIIVANIIGYLMGNYGATILNLMIDSPYIVNALSTAVTTSLTVAKSLNKGLPIVPSMKVLTTVAKSVNNCL